MTNLIYKIWLLIKGSPILYKMFLLIRGRYQKGFFPDATFDIHLAGYQRSGNTFTQRLLRELAPNIKIASHVHSIATIKLAIKHNLPIVCLIRNPESAIPSSYVKNKDFGKNEIFALAALYEYINYYEYVYKHIDKIQICVFEKVMNDPSYFIEKVSTSLNLNFTREEIEEAKVFVINDLKEDKSDGKKLSPMASNWSNSEKDNKKRESFKILKENKDFSRAIKIYDLLKDK